MKKKIPYRFVKGQVVCWTSQSAGFTRTKEGPIVQVVASGKLPIDYGVKVGDSALPRDHVSYVVRASVLDGSVAQLGRTKLYWPRVKHLELVEW
jgi:hypothetical protein